MSLETLIDRAVTLTGYDRHLLALPGGTRRMANVRKLMRMAREYEADEGRDLRGFIDALAERDAIQTREGEAPLEAEALDAVRMMTVHRAKGLEFPVVCLADLGKDGPRRRRLAADLRGRQRGPAPGRARRRRVDSARLERIKAEGSVAAEEEERRIFYVAATRAQQHLVLSGATDLEQAPGAGRAGGADALDLARLLRGAARARGRAGVARGSSARAASVAVRWTLCTPDTIDEVLPPRTARRRAGARGDRRPTTSRCSSSACCRRRARCR